VRFLLRWLVFVKTSVITNHPVRESIATLQEGRETWLPPRPVDWQRLDTHLAKVGFEFAGIEFAGIPLQKKVVVALGGICIR
jgi:hypothetical protein